MTLRNAFENLAVESKQDTSNTTLASILTALTSLLAELAQKLEPGQSINVGNFPATQPVSGPVTDTQLRATPVPVSGSVTVTDGSGPLTVDGAVTVGNFPATQVVTGPVTDTQLRASSVPVSGPATDAQLRATPLPVSGSVTVSDGSGPLTVDGTVAVSNFPATQAVSGPLTDTQLRAASVPVSGPLTDTQLRASAVPVSGPATDAQLRATPLPVSGSVTVSDGSGPLTVDGTVSVGNFPSSQPVTGPLTDTQLRASAVSVSDGAGSLTTDGSYDERYSGGKTAYSTTVAAAGDTTLITPTAGKALRVVWVSAIPSSDNTAANLVKFKFGAGGTPFYTAYAVAHWEVFQGAVNTALVLNCATAEPVSITVHFREV